MQRIVIVGGGAGGLALATQLGKANLILVDSPAAGDELAASSRLDLTVDTDLAVGKDDRSG